MNMGFSLLQYNVRICIFDFANDITICILDYFWYIDHLLLILCDFDSVVLQLL